MNLKIAPRGSGKTTELIEYAARNNIPILCFTKLEQKEKIEMANKMGLNIKTILWGENNRGTNYSKVCIDEFFSVFQILLSANGYQCDFATGSWPQIFEFIMDRS